MLTLERLIFIMQNLNKRVGDLVMGSPPEMASQTQFYRQLNVYFSRLVPHPGIQGHRFVYKCPEMVRYVVVIVASFLVLFLFFFF